MFDSAVSQEATTAFAAVDDAGVVDAITAAAREQNAICGRELAAIGELYARRAVPNRSSKGSGSVSALAAGA